MLNKTEKNKFHKGNSLKKKNTEKSDKTKKTTVESSAKKRTNAGPKDKNRISKKHCSSNTNRMPIEESMTKEELAQKTRELDNNCTFINGHYFNSIASKNNTNNNELKTPIKQVLELISTLLPLNDSENQFAWSEALYKKLSNSKTLKSLVFDFLNDAYIKLWMQQNKYVLQHLLSHPNVEKVYAEILMDRLEVCKTSHKIYAPPKQTSQYANLLQELDKQQRLIQALPQKAMGERLAYYHKPFSTQEFIDTIKNESTLAFQKEQEERLSNIRSLWSPNSPVSDDLDIKTADCNNKPHFFQNSNNQNDEEVVITKSRFNNSSIFFHNPSVEPTELTDSEEDVNVYEYDLT